MLSVRESCRRNRISDSPRVCLRRTLNDRVDYAFSLQTTLMELLNTKTSHRLEWIIIIVSVSPSPHWRQNAKASKVSSACSLVRSPAPPPLPQQLIAFEISLVLIREGLPFLSHKDDKEPKLVKTLS